MLLEEGWWKGLPLTPAGTSANRIAAHAGAEAVDGDESGRMGGGMLETKKGCVCVCVLRVRAHACFRGQIREEGVSSVAARVCWVCRWKEGCACVCTNLTLNGIP